MSARSKDIWSDDCLKFPRVETYLKNEVVRRKGLIGTLINDVKVKTQNDNEKKLRSYDRTINLNRFLNTDPKYRGIGRNRPPFNSYLEPVLVANIKHNSSKIISKITIEKICRISNPCPRFKRNIRTFDENEFRRVYSLGIEEEVEEEAKEEEDEGELVPEIDPNEDEELLKQLLAEEEAVQIKEKIVLPPIMSTMPVVPVVSVMQVLPMPPIKEVPIIKQKITEVDEEEERVATPASDIMDANLPSFADEIQEQQQFDLNKSDENSKMPGLPTRETSMNIILPRQQAAQAKHLLNKLNNS